MGPIPEISADFYQPSRSLRAGTGALTPSSVICDLLCAIGKEWLDPSVMWR